MKKIRFSLYKGLVLLAFISLTSMSTFTDTAAEQTDDVRQGQIKRIESKLSSEKTRLKLFGSQEKELLAELIDLEETVRDKRRSVDKLSKRIRNAKAELATLKQKMGDLRRSSREVKARLSKRLVALYKHIRRGYSGVLVVVRDMNQLLRRVKYMKAIMEEDRGVVLKASVQALEVENEISRIQARITEISDADIEQKILLASLKEDLERKVLRLMKVHREKESCETAVQELHAAAENLKQTLLNIEKRDEYEVDQSCRFADFKGKLAFPLKGKIVREKKVSRYARPRMREGIIIEGTLGSEVKAVFSGRVAFSGNLRGYGDLVIINHGSRFFTVSANLSKRNMAEGEVVKRGDVVGLAGKDGFLSKRRLYFEIRKGGKNLDPLAWLKVQ